MDAWNDVRSLLRVETGESDEFGKEQSKARSLLLDTVAEGRTRASRCKLLQMPAEILADIVDFLADDKPALASLALLNSDCRQLARCCQFAEICFDYSLEAQSLFLSLVRETLTKRLPLTIAACVRRVTFATNPQYVAQRHPEVYKSVRDDGEHSFTVEQKRRLNKEIILSYSALRRIAMLAISAMPNLETIVWKDRFSLDRDFFERITRSNARHITLERTVVPEPWPMEPPLTPPTWPITSLAINISLTAEAQIDFVQGINGEGTTLHPMTDLYSTLFQLCSATLESLAWIHAGTISHQDPVSLGDTPMSFPRLRHLRLGPLHLDDTAISSFLAAPLRSLDLSDTIFDGAQGNILRHSPLRSLKSFVISLLPSNIQSCREIADLIIHRKEIIQLYIHEGSAKIGHTGSHLNEFIIPAFGRHDFSNLRSLSLGWGNKVVHVSEPTLEAIGQLVSLEQLMLSAGTNFGWQHPWLINHEELRRYLGQLKGLQKLALVRDTYPIPFPGYNAEEYYEHQLIGDQEHIDAETRPELEMETDLDSNVEFENEDDGDGSEEDDDDESDEDEIRLWERAHRNRMLDEAEKYAAILPRLEWMFCGQRPMGFKQNPKGPTAPRVAVPLTKERDQCSAFLQATFRGNNDSWGISMEQWPLRR
ncbi:hypothetical protein F53441_5337 [Fusarium austroafricanum]|uniref:F-box domain-containing protein n=1 Tax=Fusarium austroafricanum TaxID=2364996 RepID=A0A8H4KL17_9HYPO|nr:hypothetical protein F53441_5337 [Fusarium austroafricanum]